MCEVHQLSCPTILELMDHYKVEDFALMLTAAILASRDLSTSDTLRQPIANDEFCRELGTLLDGLKLTCHSFQADVVLLSEMETFAKELVDLTVDRRSSVLAARLDAVLRGVHKSLEQRRFLFVPTKDVVYWENPSLFGPQTQLVFHKQALREISEAGSCYAAGRSTACVFHCMRIAEHALRMMASNLKVALSDRGKPCPIEYAEWDKVITQIKNKLAMSRTKPKGKRRESQLSLYSSAADHCEYMKDIWRNEVSHSRRLYSQAEAFAVMSRVREFVLLVVSLNFEKALRKYASTQRGKLTQERSKEWLSDTIDNEIGTIQYHD